VGYGLGNNGDDKLMLYGNNIHKAMSYIRLANPGKIPVESSITHKAHVLVHGFHSMHSRITSYILKEFYITIFNRYFLNLISI
jgi:hypothetical protein